MMKKRWVLVFAVVVIAIGGGIYYMVNRQPRGRQMPAVGSEITRTAVVTRGSLSETIGASGTVQAGQSAEINWQTSGRVAEILVGMGQEVNEGDVLAELNQETLSDDQIVAQADLIEAQQELEELLDSDTAASKAYEALLDAQEDYDDAQYRLDSINAVRTDADTLELAEIAYQRAQENVDRLDKQYSNLTNLPEDDPARASALEKLNKARKQRDNALATLNWYKGKPSDQEFAEKEAAVMIAKAALEDAQREYERLKDGPDADDIKAAQAKVDSIQAVIDQYRIEAPFDGVITDIGIEVGSLVSEGSLAFRLDDLTRLFIDLQVSEVDINAIQAGQECLVTFDAIPDTSYHGTVYDVSQVGTATSGVVYFTVTVQVTDADERVKPGMTALVDITVDTHADILLIPTRAITSEGEKRYVTVIRDGEPVQVEISMGMTSNSKTEVTAGDLAEGDTLQYTVIWGEFEADSVEEGVMPWGGELPPDGPPNIERPAFGGQMPPGQP